MSACVSTTCLSDQYVEGDFKDTNELLVRFFDRVAISIICDGLHILYLSSIGFASRREIGPSLEAIMHLIITGLIPSFTLMLTSEGTGPGLFALSALDPTYATDWGHI